MKIEIGESLMLSWLKHIKQCQVVQLNWKISSKWNLQNEDILQNIMEQTNSLFESKYSYNIFKNNSLAQLIQQSEVDAIGIAYNIDGTHIYAVDIAYHESGLNYGSREETVSRIVKKYIRTSMCILGCFNISYGNIIFASPKITPAVQADLLIALKEINAIFKDLGLNYIAELYSNESFKEEILQPVLDISAEIADTSELFMRSMQLSRLFYSDSSDKKTAIRRQILKREVNDNIQINTDGNSDYGHLKVARIARDILVPILEKNEWKEHQIEEFQNDNCSKTNFGLNYPLLTKVIDYKSRPIRYLAKPIVRINNEKYYLCSEWFESHNNNDRPFLLNWISLHK